MNQDDFTQSRQERWDALKALLRRAKKHGIKSFSADEVRTLGNLYRKTTSDLSYAKSKKYDCDLIRYLNQIIARAYGMIYLKKSNPRRSIVEFFAREFPALVRENFNYVAFTITLFIITALVGYAGGMIDARFARAVTPKQFLEIWDRPDKNAAQSASETDPGAFPLLSSWYLVNNFKVGINSFVTGILLGIGTLWLISYNGLIFGTIMSLVAQSNYQDQFLSFIMPHAPIELMAIFICGGAGFMIARAIIAPGDMYIGDALNFYGRKAVKMAVGTVILFLAAGIIEASYSRMAIPFIFKMIFSIGTVALMAWYFYLGYKPEKKRKYKIKDEIWGVNLEESRDS